jgi:hypothetical protein
VSVQFVVIMVCANHHAESRGMLRYFRVEVTPGFEPLFLLSRLGGHSKHHEKVEILSFNRVDDLL